MADDAIRLPDAPPPEWAIKEAVRRLAKAVSKRDVPLEDVKFTIGKMQGERETSVAYFIKGDNHGMHVVALATVMGIAYNIAADVN